MFDDDEEDPSLLLLRGEVLSAQRVGDGLVLFYPKGKTLTLKFSLEEDDFMIFPLDLPQA